MEGNGTTYNPLEGTMAGEVVKAAPKLTDEEVAKKQKEYVQKKAEEAKAHNEAIEKKAQDQKQATLSGLKMGGGISMAGSAGEGAAAVSTTVEQEEKEKLRNTYKKEMGDVIAMFQRAYDGEDDNQMEALLGIIKGFKTGGKVYLSNLNAEETKKALAHQREIATGTIQQYKSFYHLAKGDIDLAALESDAKAKVTAMPTSSKALDELKAQGPGQFEMDDIPPRDKAALAQVITTTLADTFKNIFGMVEGGTTQIATATTEGASVRGYEEAAAMLSQDVARSQARKDKVAAINFDLEQKYNGNLIEALGEFERRASADEKYYMQQKLNQVNIAYANAFAILGLEQQALNAEANLATNLDNYNQRKETFNKGALNAMERTKFMANAKAVNGVLAEMQAQRLERAKRMKGFDSTRKSLFVAEGISGINMTSMFRTTMDKYEAIPQEVLEDKDGQGQPSAGNRAGAIAFNMLKQGVQRGILSPSQADLGLSNIVVMANMDMLPNSFTDDFLKKIGTETIAPSPNIQATLSRMGVNDYFNKAPEGNYTATFAATSLLSTYGSMATRYAKTTKKGEGSRQEAQLYIWGR